MVDTRSGLIGLSVAGHVMEELKIVIVPAPTHRLRTEEETAVLGWDELTSQGHVTHISAQVSNLYYLERNGYYSGVCSHNGVSFCF